MEWPRGENCIKTGGGRAYIVYITSRRRTVRLGSRQELYERFLIRKLIRYSPPTQPVQEWAPPVLLPPCANYGDSMAKVKHSLLLKARLESYVLGDFYYRGAWDIGSTALISLKNRPLLSFSPNS